jgi:RND family efflux transporter MFP subunit
MKRKGRSGPRHSLLALAALASFLSFGPGACSRAHPQPREGDTFVVKRVDLHDALTQVGEVRPIHKVEIKCEASGTVRRVYAKEGEQVKARDTLLVIDPTRLLTQKKRLQLAVYAESIHVEQTRRNWESGRSLVGAGSLSRIQVQDMQDEFNLRQIALAQARLELEDVLVQLSKTVILAPVAGIIISIPIEEGEIAVSATSGLAAGTSIATLADVSSLEVVTQIGEADYARLRLGQRVTVRPQSSDNDSGTGVITFIAMNAKRVSEGRLGTFEVRVGLDADQRKVLPGMNVNVDFVLLDVKNVIGVPNAFVSKDGEGATVRIAAEGGEAKSAVRRVSLGRTDYKYYEITSGLTGGERLIASQPGG